MFKSKALIMAALAVALICAAAMGASASDDSWYINIRAVDPLTFGNHGSGVVVGVGTTAETAQSWPSTSGQTAQAESTAYYGDSSTTFHSKHDVLRDYYVTESYFWDLKIGARNDYNGGTRIAICIWNNKTPLDDKGGELNHKLAYAFYKGNTLLAWFSDAGHRANYTNWWGRPDLVAEKWNDVSLLMKDSMMWSPSSADKGFYVTDTVTLSPNGDFSELGDYRFEAFEVYMWDETPEPGSLLVLGSGLLSAAGFALRRRKTQV